MAIFLLWFAFPVCSSCNAHTIPKNRAKVVEEYVVSAKFDEKKDLPQLGDGSHPREVYRGQGGFPEAREASLFLPHDAQDGLVDDFEDGDALEERDLLVHHHHLPPPPPPAPPIPPPPPPVGLAYAPSLFAVGLITFLILLNSLQTSLLLTLKPKNGLLGAVTQPLGRRKRFAFEWKHTSSGRQGL